MSGRLFTYHQDQRIKELEQAITANDEEMQRIAAINAKLLAALKGLMKHMGDRTAENCLGGLGASCDESRAAIAEADEALK